MLLIYGANGYTGRLIVAEALRRGLRPTVAARRADTLADFKAQGLSCRAFSLEDPVELRNGIAGAAVVLHAAGPFFRTSKPMVGACLEARVHYLDITGEISVFEGCKRRGDAARDRGLVLLPGAGFDVVPTDCLAVRLHEMLPDATHLQLAFAGGGSASPGTAKTFVLGAVHGNLVRRDGQLVPAPIGRPRQQVRFADRERSAVAIPWGDLSTAFTSTRIPNIETFMPLDPRSVQALQWIRRTRWLWRFGPARRALEQRLAAAFPGPDRESLNSQRTQLWGHVSNSSGQSITGTGSTPNGYAFTATASVEAAIRLLNSPPLSGYHTPATAFGSGFLESLPDCQLSLSRDG